MGNHELVLIAVCVLIGGLMALIGIARWMQSARAGRGWIIAGLLILIYVGIGTAVFGGDAFSTTVGWMLLIGLVTVGVFVAKTA